MCNNSGKQIIAKKMTVSLDEMRENPDEGVTGLIDYVTWEDRKSFLLKGFPQELTKRLLKVFYK